MNLSFMFKWNALPKDGIKTVLLFILSFALLSAGIITVGNFYYRNYEKRFVVQMEHQLSSIAELKVGELVRYRDDRFEDGSIFFKNPSFAALVQRFFEQPSDADTRRQILDWIGKYAATDDYNQVRLLDAQGITRLSLPSGLQPAPSIMVRTAAQVIQSGQMAIEDFYWDESDNRAYLAVMVPVLDGPKTNRPIGVLVLRINPEAYLYPFIKRWPTPSLTAETLLVRRDGNDVLYLNNLRNQSNAALSIRIPMTKTEVPAVKVALGHTGIVQGKDYRGVPAVADVRAVTDSPWFIVAKIDKSEVYGPLREQFWQVVGIIGALLFSVASIVALIWRHQRVGFYKERAKSAVALREANDYLENLINYANAPIIVWNADGNISRFNHAFEKIAGRPADQVLGKGLDILFPDDQRDQAMEIVRRAGSGERFDLVEVPIQNTDGSQRMVLWNSAPILSLDGKKQVSTIAQGMDITDRNQAMAEAQREQALSNAIIDGIPGTFYLLDEQGRYTRWNSYQRDEILGKPEEQIAGMNAIDTIHPEDRTLIQARITNVLQNGKSERVEGRVLLRGGPAFIWMLMTGRRMMIAGRPFLVGTGIDITERKQAEENLAATMENLRVSNRDLEQFAYIASHDLQEPLRMVANYMQLIERRYKDKLDQDASDFIGYAVDGVVRMQQLIDSLLNYSRLQTRKRPFEMVSLDLVLQRVLRDMEGRVLETGAQITADPLPQVYGDALQIGLVFQNFISNALKFRGETSPEVRITAEESLKHWKLTIRDNGIGIAPEHQERIFKIFQRLHSRAEYPGTGIGLAICRRIIERHGGETGVESELKKGSAFWFTLPKKGENSHGRIQSD